MTLTPWDMIVIQTAIDRYEKAFPNKPSPSLAEVLAWNAKQSGHHSRSKVRRNLWSRISESILAWWQTSSLLRPGTVLAQGRSGSSPAKSQRPVGGTS